ncbi:MAG: helix-turn-helix transcriptional regulator [Pseudomonadales bacterium]|nr:helix-turn-helix transcriptional regulator [Pseudomonadales bacterium]
MIIFVIITGNALMLGHMAGLTMDKTYRSDCPIARMLDLVGDKWTLLILRDVLVFGCKKYGEFEHRVERIPTNILADRLKRLVQYGLLHKVPYQDGPKRYHYLPTPQGKAMLPVISAMRDFGETYLGGRVPAG